MLPQLRRESTLIDGELYAEYRYFCTSRERFWSMLRDAGQYSHFPTENYLGPKTYRTSVLKYLFLLETSVI